MSTRIYVGNLSYSTTNEQLTQIFAQYGEVAEATVVMDRDTGQSKGFGFVQMDNDDEARNAIAQLNGSTLDNRTIRVDAAQARPERGGRGGGGGGGYGDRPRRDDYSRDRRW